MASQNVLTDIFNVTQSGVVLSSSQYDSYGLQTQLTDPNAGTTTYNYNAYGELITQTNANAETHNIQYNALGQIVGEDGVKTDNTIRIETTNLFLLVSYCFVIWLAGKYILKSYCKQWLHLAYLTLYRCQLLHRVMHHKRSLGIA